MSVAIAPAQSVLTLAEYAHSVAPSVSPADARTAFVAVQVSNFAHYLRTAAEAAWLVGPGTDVNVLLARNCPHGWYRADSKAFMAAGDAVVRLKCRDTGRIFPRVKLAHCEYLPNWAAAFPAARFGAPAEVVAGAAATGFDSTGWQVIADRMDDAGAVGVAAWEPAVRGYDLDEFTAELRAAVGGSDGRPESRVYWGRVAEPAWVKTANHNPREGV